MKFIAAYRDVSAYNDYDFDGTPWLAVSAALWQDLNQWSGELQVTGDALDDKLSFATGLFYFAEYGDDRSQQIGFPSFNPTLPMFDGTVNNKSAGIYSQGTYRVTKQFGVTAGLRYSYDEKALTSRNRTVLPPALGGGLFSCDLPGAPNPCEIKFKDDFSAVSYTLGMDYRVTADVMVYVKTGKRFRDPQTSADRSNELFSGVAKWTANVNATYTQPISLGNLTFRADYAWRDDVVLWPWPKSDRNEPFNDDIVAAITDEATGILNARIALGVLDDTLEFALWGSNLTDERDSVGGTIFAAPVTVVNTRLRDPRTYGVTVSYRFGH